MHEHEDDRSRGSADGRSKRSESSRRRFVNFKLKLLTVTQKRMSPHPDSVETLSGCSRQPLDLRVMTDYSQLPPVKKPHYDKLNQKAETRRKPLKKAPFKQTNKPLQQKMLKDAIRS